MWGCSGEAAPRLPHAPAGLKIPLRPLLAQARRPLLPPVAQHCRRAVASCCLKIQLIVVVVVVNKRILRILPFRIRALLGAIRRTRIVAHRVGLFLVAAVCSRPHLWDDRVGLQIWWTWRSWWSWQLEHVLYPRRRATFAAPYLSVQQAAHAAHTLLMWTPSSACAKKL